MNRLWKYCQHKFGINKEKWQPFLAVFYLSYGCSFRCGFCSDGDGKPYYSLSGASLEAREIGLLLKNIRAQCDCIVLTGGEPLEYPFLPQALEAVRGLKFKEIVLTTNGYDLENYLQLIAAAVTDLVISLHTLDEAKAAKLYGRENTLAKILANIELAHSCAPKKYRLHISCVVTPDNLDDVFEVYYFAKERGLIFAACPQLVGVKAHPDLAADARYRSFYNYLIKEKKEGRPIFGTVKYLEGMRDLAWFKCHPFTMLVVSPTGDVYYPCLEIGHFAGNLLATADLQAIYRQGLLRFGPQPLCDTRCHSACALGFAAILEHPSAILSEVWLQSLGKVKAVFPKC
jgi:MoaA/NifB/PqqE/SkfB family radical SAM enzyme